MLLRLFRGTGPGVIFLIMLTTAVVWAGAFMDPRLPSSLQYDLNPMPLYAIVVNMIGNSAFVCVIFSFILILLISFLLVNFNTTIFFINERTFLPAFIYVLLTGYFPHYQFLTPVLPASLFLMLAIRRIMDAYRINGTAFSFFDASFLIATGSLFYGDLIWFALIVITGIAILRTWNPWELVLSVLGLCTPFLLTMAVYYVAGRDLGMLFSVAKYNLIKLSADYYFSRIAILGLIIIAITIMVSLFHLLSVMNIKKIKSRKTFSLLIGTFLISGLVYIILPSVSVEMIYIAAIPLSYFLAHYFIFNKKQLIPEILFTALFAFTIVQQILNFR